MNPENLRNAFTHVARFDYRVYYLIANTSTLEDIQETFSRMVNAEDLAQGALVWGAQLSLEPALDDNQILLVSSQGRALTSIPPNPYSLSTGTPRGANLWVYLYILSNTVNQVTTFQDFTTWIEVIRLHMETGGDGEHTPCSMMPQDILSTRHIGYQCHNEACNKLWLLPASRLVDSVVGPYLHQHPLQKALIHHPNTPLGKSYNRWYAEAHPALTRIERILKGD